jgi:hypothetical protein
VSSYAIYTAGHSELHIVERGRDNTVGFTITDMDGDDVTPTSGTLALYDPAGNAIQGPASCTVAAGSVHGDVLAANIPTTLALGDRYRLRFVLAMPDGHDHTYDFACHVARRLLYPVVNEATLTVRHQEVADLVAAGEDISDKIEEAWYGVQARLVGMGRRPELVMDGLALREVHLFLALHLLFQDGAASVGGEGKYAELAEKYETRYEDAWARLPLRYDADEDGGADEDKVGAELSVFMGGPGTWRF